MPSFQPPNASTVPGHYVGGNDPLYPVTRQGQRLGALLGTRPRGRTVLKAANGTYSTVDYPTIDQIAAAAVAYLGGHVYAVSDAEAAALTAAGYGGGIT